VLIVAEKRWWQWQSIGYEPASGDFELNIGSRREVPSVTLRHSRHSGHGCLADEAAQGGGISRSGVGQDAGVLEPRKNRAEEVARRDGAPQAVGPACGCGHGKTAHEHYRAGTDCALCECARFRRPAGAGLRILSALRRERGRVGWMQREGSSSGSADHHEDADERGRDGSGHEHDQGYPEGP
jgi:hypothetical protein